MEQKKYTYQLAPALESEKQGRNIDLMNRWERQQKVKLSSLSRSEWIDVVSKILSLTTSEAEEYLNSLINQ